jgi:hypothetical protein
MAEWLLILQVVFSGTPIVVQTEIKFYTKEECLEALKNSKLASAGVPPGILKPSAQCVHRPVS